MNANFRNLALWAIVGLLVVALVMLFQQPSQRHRADAQGAAGKEVATGEGIAGAGHCVWWVLQSRTLYERRF